MKKMFLIAVASVSLLCAAFAHDQAKPAQAVSTPKAVVNTAAAKSATQAGVQKAETTVKKATSNVKTTAKHLHKKHHAKAVIKK